LTAAAALRALVQQGRIARPWLPGMQHDEARVIGLPAGRRHLLLAGDWVLQPPPGGDGIYFEQVELLSRLDLQDPATVGCLLALLREAVAPWAPGGRGALTGWEGPPSAGTWYVHVQTGPGARQRFDGASEGEAIEAALVWLATVGAPGGAR
jgi:hypothetical protein